MIESIAASSSQTVESLTNFLLQNSLYALMLAALTAPVMLYFRNRNPRVEMYFWVFVMTRLILPTDLTFEYSLTAFISGVFSAGELSHALISYPHGLEPEHLSVEQISGVYAGTGGTELRQAYNWNLFGILAWGSVTLIILGRLWVQHKRLVRFVDTCVRANPGLQKRVAKMQARLGYSRRIRVLIAKDNQAPFTFGLARPTVCIPMSLLSSQQTAQLDAVIAHEVAHIRRFDYIWIRLQVFIIALFWFHPLCWLAHRRINYLRERICDQVAVCEGNISLAIYRRTLLAMLHPNPLRGWAHFFLMFRGSSIQYRNRITKLNGEFTMTKPGILQILLIILLSILLLPMASQQHLASARQNGSANKIEFHAPIKTGKITSHYGNRIHPILKRVHLHKGTDIAAPTGTNVYATADGVVTWMGREGGSGITVRLEHKYGYTSRYCQLDTAIVSKGDRVSGGELIAKVGNTGLSTAPHLHFELMYGDTTINAVNYVQLPGN